MAKHTGASGEADSGSGGKHGRRPRRGRRLVLSTVGMFVMVAVLTAASFTYAYFHETNSYVNAFTTADYNVALKEDFTPINNWAPGITKTKSVYVTNTGTVDAFVRIKYSEAWNPNLPLTITDAQGQTEDVVLKNWTSAWTPQWTHLGDYWYYNKVLKAGTQTDPLLASVTLNPLASNDAHAANYGNASYSLTFHEEDIQADNATISTVTSSWSHTPVVNTDGSVTWN